MSTTSHHLITPPAPWRSSFLDHISQMPSPEFVLSTIHPVSSSSSSPNPPPNNPQYLPRARFCIYRGLWATLPENKHNDAPMNARIYESDLPTFTTDVRMEKVPELFSTGPGHAQSLDQTQGSGGGGPVEAVWWVKEAGIQWRMRGVAWVVGQDVEDPNEHSPSEDGQKQQWQESSGVRSAKAAIGARMRVLQPGKEGEWSWARELTAHFGNCSPGMRGTWRNPPPGTKVKEGQPEEGRELGQKVQDLHDKVARDNFRVVVIVPDTVERTDLSDPAKARRHRFTWREEDGRGEWSEEELWP